MALASGAGQILYAASTRGPTVYTTFLATRDSIARNRTAFAAMVRAVRRMESWLQEHERRRARRRGRTVLPERRGRPPGERAAALSRSGTVGAAPRGVARRLRAAGDKPPLRRLRLPDAQPTTSAWTRAFVEERGRIRASAHCRIAAAARECQPREAGCSTSSFAAVTSSRRRASSQGDVAIAGETIAAVTAPGALAAQPGTREIDAERAHRHAGRHRPARPPASRVDQARRHAARDRGARAGRPRRAVRRHHHVHRFRLLAGWRVRPRRHRGARPRFRRQEPVRLGLPHHAALGAAARVCRAARRGDRGRVSDAEDFHHQHPADAHRPDDRFRRHLGSVSGAGQVGRARRHPCRGQRHRHAHVRQADPRRSGRLREPRRGPQSPVRGPELPPHPAACRKRARHGALHDARFRRHRRRRHRRGARASSCRSTARRCTSTCSTRPTTTSVPTGRCITPIRR